MEITQSDTRKNFRDFLNGVEFITVPDNPFGRPGPGSVSVAFLIKSKYNVKAMGTINTRDRNKIGIISEVLAALELNLDGLFVVYGDSAKIREVRELDVFQTISLIKKYRQEYGLDFHIGATINLSRENELRFVKKKMESGADFFITQTVYSSEMIRKNNWIKYIAAPVYAGFMPILNKKMVNFYSRHMNIPENIQKRLLLSTNIFNENIEILRTLVDGTKGYVEGYHIMPLGNVEFMKNMKEVFKI